jgi:hypothetical protein
MLLVLRKAMHSHVDVNLSHVVREFLHHFSDLSVNPIPDGLSQFQVVACTILRLHVHSLQSLHVPVIKIGGDDAKDMHKEDLGSTALFIFLLVFPLSTPRSGGATRNEVTSHGSASKARICMMIAVLCYHSDIYSQVCSQLQCNEVYGGDVESLVTRNFLGRLSNAYSCGWNAKVKEKSYVAKRHGTALEKA